MISDTSFPIDYSTDSYATYDPWKEGRFMPLNSQNGITIHHTCREVVGKYFTGKSSHIAMRATDADAARVNAFFEIIENKLKLPKNQRTIVYQGKNKEYVVLKVPKFWLKNATTRGFYTLFFRCAVAYFFHDNFSKALKDYLLTNTMKNQIQWFLKGNTQPTYKRLKGKGIVDHFTEYNYGIDYKTLLVKPV